MLSVAVPVAVLATVTATDWISGLVIAVTLPLVPLFAVLVGLHTKTQTRRQWRLLAQLSGHFLDVVQGLPTLKVFGRAKAQEQVIARVTGEHRAAAMATLRVAFLSALVLELSAAVATALVAVETGLRLLYGHLPYQAALLVLLLTPEAYLPLRAVATQYHASAEGSAAAEDVFQILDTPVRPRPPAPPARPRAPVPDLRSVAISLDGVSVAYPDRDGPALARLSLTVSPGELIMLTGASGAGKTTLLRTAAAVHRARLRHRPRRRNRPGDHPPGALARTDRLGSAAAATVPGVGGRQHRSRPARRFEGRDRGCRPAGRSRRVH